MKEKLKRSRELGMNGGMELNFDDKRTKAGVKGEVFLRLHDKNTGELLEEQRHNVITDAASVLIARLVKDNTEPLHGAWVLGLGTGSSGWDLQDPPAATAAQTALEAELIRKTFSSTNFITPTGTISATPTNIVDLTTVFTESEAVGPLVEMGLFGGDVTLTAGSGTLINYLTFKVINKSNTSILTLVWRLTF